MFVSEKGDGWFWLTVSEISPEQLEEVKRFQAEIRFSYEVMRDESGNVVTDKNGNVQLANFEFLKTLKKGQNK